MKSSKILLVLSCFSAFSIFGMQRVSSEDLEIIKKGLKEFHKSTTSSPDSSKPDVSSFKKSTLLVAKMDSFGCDRYFAFRTNDHVNELVGSVQQGAGMRVSWYCLKDAYKYDLMKIVPLKKWRRELSQDGVSGDSEEK